MSERRERSGKQDEFWYRSHAMGAVVAALGLKHRFTRPYTPKTNSKAECFIQTSLREGDYAHAYSHSDQRPARLPLFLRNTTGIALNTPSNSARQSPESVSRWTTS